MRNHDILKLAAGLSFVFYGVLSGAAHAENTDRSKAEKACRSSSVILCENWEDEDWSGWSDYNVGDSLNKGGFRGGLTCATGNCLLPYPGYNNSKAVALRLPKDAPDAIYPRGAFNEKVDPDDTIYLRWRAYWSKGFEYNTTNNKHIYLIPNARSGDLSHRVGFFARGSHSNPEIGRPYFHLYSGHVDLAPGSWQETAARNNGGDIYYYANQPGTEDLRIRGGQWYEFQIRVTPNPVGKSFGGRLQAWIDGVLVADYSDNVSLRKANQARPYDGVWLSSYFGGGGQTTHPDQYVVYDDIIVSKNQRVPDGGIGASDSRPSSPILRTVK